MGMRYIKRYRKRILFSVMALGLFVAAFGIMSGTVDNKAQALCPLCWCESCPAPLDFNCAQCLSAGQDAIDTLRDQVIALIPLLEAWISSIWNFLLSPQMPFITEQLSAASMTTTVYIGSFFDAKHQLETQAVLDKFYVRAIRDYQPSVALCRFGTVRRGLASTEIQTKLNQEAMANLSLARHLGREGVAAFDQQHDWNSRMEQFKTTYCDPEDNKGFMGGSSDYLCGTSGAPDPDRYNKDIHITKTLYQPKTFDGNFLDNTLQNDEEDILALSRNLFGHPIFARPSAGVFNEDRKGDEAVQNRRNYHRFRSLIAKKNVIENSYFAIASQKMRGTGASTDYLVELLEQVGLTTADARELIGDEPSYNAQMEVLTKKLVQNPGFITALTDKPVNVSRQQAALMSFELMQERDAYDSMRRQEVLLALMLEKLLKKRFETLNAQLAVQ